MLHTAVLQRALADHRAEEQKDFASLPRGGNNLNEEEIPITAVHWLQICNMTVRKLQ